MMANVKRQSKVVANVLGKDKAQRSQIGATKVAANTDGNSKLPTSRTRANKPLANVAKKQEPKSPSDLVREAKEAATKEIKSLDLNNSNDPIGSKKIEQIATRLALISPSDQVGLERVIGTRDIVGISFLHRALIAARSVCRIKVAGSSCDPPIYGTGFLIAPSLLLTNHHVLPSEDAASFAVAEFDYELDLNWVERQRHIFGITPSRVFFTDPGLDITVVAIAPVAHNRTPITEFGTLKLISSSGKALVGEYVSIIQHPQGEPKQVVMRENQIIQVDLDQFGSVENFIHYTADTEPGSSGSPVFNDQWDLVAVHHKSIPDMLSNGWPKNVKGDAWSPEQGESARAWLANEGVRVSAIVKSIRNARDDDPHAARINAILAFEPPIQMRNTTRPNGVPLQGNRENYRKQLAQEDTSAYPERPAFESTRYLEPEYDVGFDTNFLEDFSIPLPKILRRKGFPKQNICFIPEGYKDPEIKYTHFSLVMHKVRKLALWTAVNIDGTSLYAEKLPNAGWRKDPRVGSCQTFGAVYGKNRGGTGVQIDKGHQVRRLDPVWGADEVAIRAAEDTFHYTNAVPQEHVYNSELWGNLEDYVLEHALNHKHKASVLTGPVLRDDDRVYADGRNEWQIPSSFWKICIFVRKDKSVSVTGFVMDQTEKIGPILESNRFNAFTIDEVKVHQRPISDIETLTGLDFGILKKKDRMGVVETTVSGSLRPIHCREDIEF